MKKLKLTKLMASTLVVASLLALSPIGASAEELQKADTSHNYVTITTIQDLQNTLNSPSLNYVDTPIGRLTFKYTIDKNDSIIFPYDYSIKINYGDISNSPYGLTAFYPYDLEYSIKITQADKDKTKEILRNYQTVIANDAILKCIPDKKVECGFYVGFYKYPALKIGYEATKFLTWTNYSEDLDILPPYNGSKITSFHWKTYGDDYNFTK